MKWYKLQTTEPQQEAARTVLQAVLDNGLASGVITGIGTAGEVPVRPALTTTTSGLEDAVPFSPHQLINAADLVAKLAEDKADTPIAAVLKPCEQRAFVELVKFSQAERFAALTITTDCIGTVDTTQPQARFGAHLEGDLREAKLEELRPACKLCTDVSVEGDVHLGFWGADEGLLVGIDEPGEQEDEELEEERRAREEALNRLVEVLDLVPVGEEELERRQAALNEFVSDREEHREERFEELHSQFGDLWNMAEEFASCRLCFNCRQACPICYCRECLFEGPVFEPEVERYVRLAEKRELLPLPTDVLLFHLTRMNHMVLSCVGCGQCTSACPNDLPVAEVFSAFGERARKVFDYKPGMGFDDPPPLTEYDEEELDYVTEPTEKVMSE